MGRPSLLMRLILVKVLVPWLKWTVDSTSSFDMGRSGFLKYS